MGHGSNMRPPRSLVYVSTLKLADIIDQIDKPGQLALAATLKVDFGLLSAEVSTSGTDRSLRNRGQGARLAVAEQHLRQRAPVGDLTADSGWFAGQAEMGWKPLQDCQTVLFCGYSGSTLVVLGGSVSNVRGYPASEVQTGSHVTTIRQAVLGNGHPDDFGRDLEAAAREICVMPQPVRFLARVLRRGPLTDGEYVLGTPLYVELADAEYGAGETAHGSILPAGQATRPESDQVHAEPRRRQRGTRTRDARSAPSGEAHPDFRYRGTSLLAADPRRIGRYNILQRLGEGSMGIVFHARGGDNRDVALKVIRPELAADARFLGRFTAEATAARQVRSPFTARVIEAACTAQPAYLVTEFISGPTLQEHVARTGPLSLAEAKKLCSGTAAALATAHGAGIIHGDLAPSNVILSPSGPKVIDFGIARPVSAGRGFPPAGLNVGTPAYMSPEQIENAELTLASDVFSWASTMVYAMTGRQPFGTSSCMATVWYQIIDHEPDLSEVPEQLRGILAAAFSKNPGARPTAGKLEDLLRAISDGTGGDERRLRRRWWRPVIATGAAAALAAGGIAAALLANQVAAAPTPRATVPLSAVATLPVPEYTPQAVEYSPSGRFLAAGSANSDDNPSKGCAYVWDLAAKKPWKPLSFCDSGPNGGVWDVAWKPNGAELAVADNNGTAYVWNMANGALTLFRDPDGSSADSVAWNRTGTILAVGDSNGVIYLWDVADHRWTVRLVSTQLAGQWKWVNALAWSPDGAYLAAAYQDGAVYAWTIATQQPVPLPTPLNGRAMNDVAWQSHARDVLSAGSDNGDRYQWNVGTGRQPVKHQDSAPQLAVAAVAWNTNGTVLASGHYGPNGATYLWYGASQTHVKLPGAGGLGVEDVAFAPGGKTLATADQNGTIDLWAVPPPPG
jgi:hypothetical protein